MDSLQAVLAAQTPVAETFDQTDLNSADEALVQAVAVVPEDMSSAPLAIPLEDGEWQDEATDAVDSRIFAALVAG